MRSCSSSVLVEQTAEQVTPVHLGWVILGDDPGTGWVWRLQPQRSVRAVLVAGSARGAVPASGRARFPGPPSEPGVPVIPAPGSPRGPLPTNGCVATRLRSTQPVQAGTPVFTGGSCPADTAPQPRCAPSPCARLSRARTTTGTPPRPAANSRRRACPPPEGGEGGDGSLPTFTTTQSAGVGRVAGAHCCAPAP
jgi:hypothetical protein